MGSTQSKSAQPVIFYNQSSPLQFSQAVEEPVKSTKEVPAISNEKIEKLVRERVAEELKRNRDEQEKVNQRAYGDLAKKNIQNDHNSVAMSEDIENMIQKLQRSAPADIPANIAERQEELIVCYK
ncbi:uncharacterized protein EV154DRAFT_413288 [Mucor mucedo]|uniref:uncharacterized protein n=1 Tax=Mucor mucedo TaxID=29922 RepID=UPI00221FDC6A|nr:uncharacterized protein EV154DRAFT_413288 [Mucor mucedo]KAI7895584.1 hypothetical protein EV154DRAFT_413288 [Mucor mucedo]